MAIEKNAEKSLDEVLSSIKQMVTDDEPPVLELTDMVSDDGSVVKVKKDIPTKDGNTDMSSFLRLIQENSDTIEEASKIVNTEQHFNCKPNENSLSGMPDYMDQNPLMETIKVVLRPILEKWVNENLREISTNVIREEVRKLLYSGFKK